MQSVLSTYLAILTQLQLLWCVILITSRHVPKRSAFRTFQSINLTWSLFLSHVSYYTIKLKSNNMRLTKYQLLLHYFNVSLVIITGLLGIISVAIFPRPTKLLALAQLIPFPLSLASRTATLLFSIAMLILALNLHRRRRRAYLTLLFLTAASVFTHLIKGFDLFEASFSFFTFISLLTTNHLYNQPSQPLTIKLRLQRNQLFLFAILIYLLTTTLWLHYYSPHSIPFQYIRLSIDLSLIFLEIYFFAAFFAPLAIQFHHTKRDYQQAKTILRRSSQPDYLNSLKLTSDKTLFLDSQNQTFLSYTIINQYALVLSNPVGNPKNFKNLFKEFHQFLNHYHLKPLLYQINDQLIPTLNQFDYKTFPIGQEALIDLVNFSIPNLKTSKLRQTYRKFIRHQFTTTILKPPFSSSTYHQLKTISDAWLKLPNHFERQFSVGYFSHQYLDQTPVFAVLNPQGDLIAWTNLHLFPWQQFATADLLRYSDSIPNGTMEFLFISLFLYLKKKNYHTFSLGLSPLPPELSPKEKVLTELLKRLSFIFRFTGVANFKAKFATHWQTRYLAYRHPQDLLLYPKIFRQATTISTTISIIFLIAYILL